MKLHPPILLFGVPINSTQWDWFFANLSLCYVPFVSCSRFSADNLTVAGEEEGGVCGGIGFFATSTVNKSLVKSMMNSNGG